MRLHRIVAASGLAVATAVLAGAPAAAADRDCSELTPTEAQVLLDHDPSDPNDLDRDNDGLACESGDGGSSAVSLPQGGVGTGAGGTAGLESEALFACGGLALAGAAGIVLYRRRLAPATE